MTQSNLLDNKEIDGLKSTLKGAVLSLFQLTEKIDHAQLKQTVSDVSDRIDDPFMFVIVGEVKAGKSSFINALLESKKEICKVAPTPMTDTIQQIIYGEDERIESVSEFLKRIYQPVEILKEIAIVDTPGTNTIVKYHQEITEQFIPASDLIVFVFEAKNPYRQSSWEFFDYIKNEWHKKIIFVLQQKDLLDEADLNTNIHGVIDQAIKKGIPEPNVFAVSAKQELNDQKELSGFINVRDYIREKITSKKASLLKIENNVATSRTINNKIYEGVDLRKRQYEADIKFRKTISETLNNQEERTKKQINALVDNLLSSYDRITTEKEMELKDGLGVFTLIKRSFRSMMGGSKNAKQWLDELAKSLESEFDLALKDRLQEGVIDIADSIQDMGKLVDAQIKNSETILKDDHEIFADIAERRSNVLKDLQQTFSGFLSRSENFYDQYLLKENTSMTPNIAAGGGIAVVGVIITMVTSGTVFDITGGILTTIGLAFAGITIGLKRGQIIREYKEAILKGRKRIEREITEKLTNYTSKIKSKIDQNFTKFDQLLMDESNNIEWFESEYSRINSDLDKINDALIPLLK